MSNARTPLSRPMGAFVVMVLMMLGPIVHSEPQSAMAPYSETLPNSVVKIDMVPVPAGSVMIGGKKVEVKPFYIAKTETLWEAFDLYLASGPASPPYDQTEFAPDAIARPSKSYILPDKGWGHAGFPVISVSFTTVEMFCRWMATGTKKKYRVPTEAEWELAARAGLGEDGKLDKATADASAWYSANSNRVTHPVAKKAPNKLGLYDIFGNVGEWATDMEGKPVLCGNTFQDPIDKLSATMRRRWEAKWQDSDPQIPKSRWWLADGPFCGFRLVCEP